MKCVSYGNTSFVGRNRFQFQRHKQCRGPLEEHVHTYTRVHRHMLAHTRMHTKYSVNRIRIWKRLCK